MEGTPGDHLVHPPSSKQEQQEQVVPGCVLLVFEYLQGWRLHILAGQPVPVFDCPHSGKISPSVEVEVSVFHFVCFD